MNSSDIEDYCTQKIESALKLAKERGLDYEKILAEICAKHLGSDESDSLHMSGITFAEKFNSMMM